MMTPKMEAQGLFQGHRNHKKGKKQDTKATPERMKIGEAEMMEIDDGKVNAVSSTPPGTPQQQQGKRHDKEHQKSRRQERQI